MSSATPSGTDAMAGAKGRTGATKQQKYGYRGEKRHQAAERRTLRIKELELQLRNALSLERTFHIMALQVEAELAQAREA